MFFVQRIERMRQVGLIRKWMTEYLPKRDKCWKSKQTDVANHTVNMDDMQGSFFVLLLGTYLPTRRFVLNFRIGTCRVYRGELIFFSFQRLSIRSRSHIYRITVEKIQENEKR